MRASEILNATRARGTCLREELSVVPGLRLKEGHRGVYEHAGVRMHVLIEGADRIGLRVSLPAPPTPAQALATAGQLAGNLRFARVDANVTLVADTLLDGVGHLSGTLAQLARSAGSVLDGELDAESPAPDEVELPCERVDEAVAGLGWPEDAVVRKDAGCWELRPRMQLHHSSAPLPVRVTRERAGLAIRRTLLRVRPDASALSAGPALAELALHLNGGIRLARLAVRGQALVAEALLRGELVTTAWLGETVRAVAAVSGACQPSITLLTQVRRLAEVFLAASTPSHTAKPHEVLS